MTYRLIFLASDIPLSIAHLEIAEKFIEANGIGLTGKITWIAPHNAAQIGVQNLFTLQQMSSLRGLLQGDKIDILCTPADTDYRLFLADMDSTIVRSETLDELAAKAGLKDKIAAITARAMNGEIDFKSALKERVALLQDLPLSALSETLAETELCEGADVLVAALAAQKMTCVLVSGGFTFFTEAIAKQCGFHHHHGNILGIDGDRLNGTVVEPVLDKDSKLAYLKSYTQELGIDLAQTIAIGDGANDIPMLAAAGLGIGYRPKPVVAETILNVLKYADLGAIRHLQ